MADYSATDKAFQAIRSENVDKLLEILSANPEIVKNIRWSGFTLLHRAAGEGQTDICKLLISAGANVNAKSVGGCYTPLHIALANGFAETAIFLIDKGAFPWSKSKYKEDPFDYGIKRGHRQLAEDLRSKIAKREMQLSIKQCKTLVS